MTQNAEIIIEQFDNGITLCWHDLDGEVDDERLVVHEYSLYSEVGKLIMGDVNLVKKDAATNRVKLTIKYEPL